jgi:Lipocalin-like domain
LTAEDLVGTWRLRSWRNVASDGSAVDPLGEKPVGYIFYKHDGYMSVEIMAAHRAPYHDPDAFGGTPEERSEAISTYLSYSGPFEVLPEQDSVIHHIDVCSYPNWIGNAHVRFAKLDGDLLTLSTKPKSVWLLGPPPHQAAPDRTLSAVRRARSASIVHASTTSTGTP